MPEKNHTTSIKIGDRFGRWEVIGDREYRGKGQPKPHWLCRCDCGREVHVLERNLIVGASRRCIGCRVPGSCVDEKTFIGTEVDSWTVLEFAGKNRAGGKQFLCRCECGRTKLISSCHLRPDHTPKCRGCLPDVKERGAHRIFWKRLLWSAADRKLAVEVTMDDLLDLLKAQHYRCALTGMPIALARTSTEHHTGVTTGSVDRIDSSLGYVKGNFCWVHKRVNLMKGATPLDEFVKFCCAVAAHAGQAKPKRRSKSAGSPESPSLFPI